MAGIDQLGLDVEHGQVDTGDESELVPEILVGREHAQNFVFGGVDALALDSGLDSELDRTFSGASVCYCTESHYNDGCEQTFFNHDSLLF